VQLLRDGIVDVLKGDLRELVGLSQASFVSVGAAWLGTSQGVSSQGNVLRPVLEDAQHLFVRGLIEGGVR
jgi:hypothetical protein